MTVPASSGIGRTKLEISPARRRLVEMMHDLRFGLIDGVVIREGEPIFDPAPQIRRDIKIGAADTSRSELTADDFELKTQVIELFEHLDELRTGLVDTLEVRYGLPVRLVVRQSP